MRRCINSAQRPQGSRAGVAATEFAVCLPILMVIIMGTIEACSMVYLKQSLSVAAYEGARASLRAGGSASTVNAACNGILSARNVKGAVVTVSPGNFANQPAQTWITVRVEARGRDNSVISGWFYDNLVLDATATMMKEFD